METILKILVFVVVIIGVVGLGVTGSVMVLDRIAGAAKTEIIESPPSWIVRHGPVLREVSIDGVRYVYNINGGLVIKPESKSGGKSNEY